MEVVDNDPSSMKHRKCTVQRLRCSVQSYDWGRKGGDSEVARLFALNSGSQIDPEKPYAEFWMGTHDSGPSFLVRNRGESNGFSTDEPEGVRLKSWVSKNPNVLGEKMVLKWGPDLPYLFKVPLTSSNFMGFYLGFWRFYVGSDFLSPFLRILCLLGAFGGQGIVNTGSPR